MRISAHIAQPVPWKNGGGVTRELAAHAEGGQMIWRVSLADIEQSGPFSAFPGLARIHCIVEGAGHVLSNRDIRLEARPFQPLHFEGGLPLDCRLLNGPCRAFNVIYDPKQTSAEMAVLRDGPVQAPKGKQVFFAVSGCFEISGSGRLGPGEGIVTESAASGMVAEGGAVVHVRF